MKYEINKIKDNNTFTPFSLTLTFETKKECDDFHDNVMGVITKVNSHQFHADIFNAGRGEIDKASGKI